VANNTSKRWLILGGLSALTFWLVWNAPEPEVNVVTVKPNTAKHSSRKVVMSDVPQMETESTKKILLKQRESINGKSIDLFAIHRKQQPKRNIKPIIKPVANKKPTAPPLPFTYIGKLMEGKEIKIFLMNGQALHIVSEGDKVGQDYQLTHVGDEQLSWLYLPLSIAQKMSIGKAP